MARNGGGSDRRQAAPRFLGFFCARLSCRAATMSITLLRVGCGGRGLLESVIGGESGRHVRMSGHKGP
jgi:hypothetical protein